MLTRYRPNPLSNPFSLFDALLEGRPLVGSDRTFAALQSGPRFSLEENEDGYVLSGDLPGVKADDLKVTVEDGVLTIAGQRDVGAPEGYTALRQERGAQRFERSYRLGDRIDANGAEAKLDDGVLTLTLPKRPEVKPRQIEIRTNA